MSGIESATGESGQYKNYKRRWGMAEDLELISKTGSVSTEYLAKKFGKSPGAVQIRYQVLGLSPRSSEFRLTAAELSRRTGIPPTTLRGYLALNKLPGIKAEKVGLIWRIEWDGVTPIVPSWSGHGIKKMDAQTTEKQDIMNCLNCGTLLPRKGRFTCSGPCRREYVKTRMQEKAKKL